MKNTILFGNQSLTWFTSEICAKILQNILQIFFVAKNRKHCEQMVDISASIQWKYFKLSLFDAKFYNLTNAFLKIFLT